MRARNEQKSVRTCVGLCIEKVIYASDHAVDMANVIFFDLEDKRRRCPFDSRNIEASGCYRHKTDGDLEWAPQAFAPGDLEDLHVVAGKVFRFKAYVDKIVGHDDIETELVGGVKGNRAKKSRP
jgi:hypothetical protein